MTTGGTMTANLIRPAMAVRLSQSSYKTKEKVIEEETEETEETTEKKIQTKQQ